MVRAAFQRFAFAVVTVSAVSGCSDDAHRLGAGARPDQLGDAVIGLCRSHADYELIDDMEDGLDAIAQEEGRSGFWFAFNDRSPTGTQTPNPYATFFEMEKIEPRRGASWYAIRTHGSGFTEWGAGIGFDLKSHEPYDASRYTGISFWARVGPETNAKVRLDITDRNTAPQGFVCVDDQDPNAGNRCYDNFGVDVIPGTEWEHFEYTWSELSQKGFSMRRYDAITRSALFGVRFQVDAGPFDFWIDDVAFTCPRD